MGYGSLTRLEKEMGQEEEYDWEKYDAVSDWAIREFLRWQATLPKVLHRTMITPDRVWDYVFEAGDELSDEDLEVLYAQLFLEDEEA